MIRRKQILIWSCIFCLRGRKSPRRRIATRSIAASRSAKVAGNGEGTEGRATGAGMKEVRDGLEVAGHPGAKVFEGKPRDGMEAGVTIVAGARNRSGPLRRRRRCRKYR